MIACSRSEFEAICLTLVDEAKTQVLAQLPLFSERRARYAQ